MRRHRFAVGLLLLLALAAVPAATQQAERPAALEGFDEFVAGVMAEWKVPGLAIAVVADGKLIFAQGYGYRDLERQLPVTPDTLFAIGSVSKSFTVTAMGMLADDGRMDWDQPVREYLPAFRLHDAVASERMTPRDLVTHRSGLPRHDLLWYGGALGRRELFSRIRHLEPSKDFRSTWQYQNLMYLSAGILVEDLTGESWETVVRRRILDPLGMQRSNFSVTASERDADFSWPYARVKDEVRRVPFRNIDAIGPAGSINSSVREMANYLLLHLGAGKFGEQQLLSEANARQMQQPQMVIPGPMQHDEVFHTSYGMGFFVTSYRGHKLVHHGGGIDGFIALLSFLPRKNIGVIVLTNLSPNPLPTILSYNVYDRLLGLDPVDWAGRTREQEKKAREAAEEAKKKQADERKTDTRPAHPLGEYAGEYEDPGYGLVKVENNSGSLRLVYNSFTAPLEHYHFEIFTAPEIPLNPLSEKKVGFQTNLRGEVDRLAIQLESNVPDIVFTRRGEKVERAVLEQLPGDYELGPVTMTVALRDDGTLTLFVPGQPLHELVPERGLRFAIKGLPGFVIEFQRDADGEVNELISHQPNGRFVARRKQ